MKDCNILKSLLIIYFIIASLILGLYINSMYNIITNQLKQIDNILLYK